MKDNIDEPALVPKPAPVKAAAPAPEPVKKTPEQWARVLGHMKLADPRIPQSTTHADWQHAAADKLHGWGRHAYHYQAEPMLLTQDDYQAALDAAAEYPNKPAHEPAMAPSHEDVLKQRAATKEKV